MVYGWRRAFCTSIPKDREPKVAITEKLQQHSSSPKPSSKFRFFSNPSTPRFQSEPVSSPSLRCKTATATTTSLPNSPKLHCKISTPKKSSSSSSSNSSPRSPSTFSLLKSTLKLSKSKCGICSQSIKAGAGTAIFTAECSHVFHFPCIASHVRKNHTLLCPLCDAVWKDDPPLLSLHSNPTSEEIKKHVKVKTLRVYNDDEPLSPTSGFNPIPESDENDDGEEATEPPEFQGFFVNPLAFNRDVSIRRAIDARLLPEAAIVASGRGYDTYAVVLKVKAPPSKAVAGDKRRAPVDLVTVVDVSGSMNGGKLQMMKRAMKLVVSSLGSTDRLSIVAFSAVSKRLSPLRRMDVKGKRSARKIVDALGCSGDAMSVNDALKKAAKVLEDRRERNPVAKILILSSAAVSSTRFQSDVHVHAIGFGDVGSCGYAPPDDAFLKCVGDLLNVAVLDLRLQLGFMSGSGPVEIAGVYSVSGQPVSYGPGLVRVGDLYAEEERELLVEIRAPSTSSGAHHVLSVQSSYRDPSSQELVYSKEQGLLVPRPQAVRSSLPKIERLRNLHVTTRAVAESRRLAKHGDLRGSQHLLSSARALLIKSGSKAAEEFLKSLEAELAEVQRRRQVATTGHGQRTSGRAAEEKSVEPLTPTSAWRAAERLAKVAIMRKSMNRVSDLHGFEDARF